LAAGNAAAATWAVLTIRSPVAMHTLGFFVPFDLWALIALGHWWFLRRYSKSAGLHAFFNFLGGMVGTLAWLNKRQRPASLHGAALGHC
jgi:hypothetical protein